MRILVTGYGSFGGIAVNPSAVVVNKLAEEEKNNNKKSNNSPTETEHQIDHADRGGHEVADEQPHQRSQQHVELVTRVIEVDYAEALHCSNWARNELDVDFAIHIGVYPGSGCIFLERRAFRNGYISKDVNGSVPFQNCCELSLSDVGGIDDDDEALQRRDHCPAPPTPPVATTGHHPQQKQSSPTADCCLYTMLDLDRLQAALSDALQSDGTTTLDIAISEDPGRYLCGYIYYCSLLGLTGRSLFVHIPPFDKTHTPQLITRLIRQLIAEVVKQISTTNAATTGSDGRRLPPPNLSSSPTSATSPPPMLSSLMISNGLTVSFPLARTTPCCDQQLHLQANRK